jgi:hypothetical protein
VMSNVEILPSVALARRDEAAWSRVRSCMQRLPMAALGQSLPASERVTGVTVADLSVPAAGGVPSKGLRISVTVSVRGTRVPMYLDATVFAIGQTEVGLIAMGLAQPFPATTENQLYSLLVQRAQQDLTGAYA